MTKWRNHLLGEDRWTEAAVGGVADTHDVHLKLSRLHKVRGYQLKKSSPRWSAVLFFRTKKHSWPRRDKFSDDD